MYDRDRDISWRRRIFAEESVGMFGEVVTV